MDGVRRFLVGNTAGPDPPQHTPAVSISPLSLNTKPPADNDRTNILTESPVSTTSPLSLKRDRPRPQDDDKPQQPSSRKDFSQPIVPPRRTTQAPPPNTTPLAVDHGTGENAHSTRDELLLSLLASEAVVECQGHEILSSEQVEELKKVRRSRQLNRSPFSHNALRSTRPSHRAWLNSRRN